MALLDLQRELTRILTDPSYRARFLAAAGEGRGDQRGEIGSAPDASATAMDLEKGHSLKASLLAISSDEPLVALASVPPDQLRHYAEGLIRKRRGAVAASLPATSKALGPRHFADLFRRHAADVWPTGPKRHRDDAIAFAGRLARGDLLPEIPPWLADAASFESAFLRSRDPSRRLVLILLDHRPDDLIPALLADRPGAEVPRRPTLVAWLRAHPGADPRYLRISAPRLLAALMSGLATRLCSSFRPIKPLARNLLL
ncbi:hypothetical protein [Aquisphaera insulae]|uniref:hypothetical protein n=1 Tax=Aquisphaera insulae TaxID=2712864 RepID=UPI0013EC11E3|nr:hypothetical protein [Aquisphaera insulae]